MKKFGLHFRITGFLLLISGSVFAQNQVTDAGFQSITEAELRNHLYFLASDYMNGRQALSDEYEIAAQYVATQFAAAGLQPVDSGVTGNQGFLQGVPFSRTTYSEELIWHLDISGVSHELVHNKDFKIVRASELSHDDAELVFVGYGIMEPDHQWDDLEGLDVEGKIAVCLHGAPTKRGKPVLPDALHARYNGSRGNMIKVFTGLASKGAAGVILVDPEGFDPESFEAMTSSFSTQKTTYAGDQGTSRRTTFPSIYFARPEFLEVVMPKHKGKVKPRMLTDIRLTTQVEVLQEETIYSNNVVGIVPGTDPELRNEYLVVGAHLDHVLPSGGQVNNGADDNASGSVGVIEIAGAVALNPVKRSVVFVTFTAEEMGLLGSKYFMESELFPVDQIKFMMNLDMIGRSDPEHEESRAHYVRTSAKYLHWLTRLMTELNDEVTDFPLIFRDDAKSPGGSDHMSFLARDIPGFFFFSGMHPDLHRPGDDPEKIDYQKAQRICQLGYLLIQKLGNESEDVFPN